MKNICFLIPSLDPGGIETYLLRFIRYCSDRDMKVTVLIKGKEKGALYDEYKVTGATLFFYKSGYLNFMTWIQVYRLFRKQKFDTVCDFTANFSGIYMMLAKWAGTSNRYAFYRQSSNHFPSSFLNNKYNHVVNTLVYHFASGILSNSQTAIDAFFPYRRTDDNRFKIIRNGFDLKMFEFEGDKGTFRGADIPSGAFVVGHTGRYDKSKNHTAILQVAEILCKKYNDIYFVCVGKDTEKMQSLVDEKGLTDRVKLVGIKKNIPQILRSFDVYYFPSITEGQPNALIEALISGLPIVASNIAPIRETLPQELYNQLTDPFDVQGAVMKIEELYEKKSLREQLNYSGWAKREYNAELRFGDFYNVL
jgi:glycosyltransferase involved in cell wall biosynthesis